MKIFNTSMKIKFLIIIAFYVVAFSSCNKDDKDPATILVSKTWKKGIVDLNPSTNPSGEVLYNIVQNCDEDDTFKFGSDGTVMINRNTIKCDQHELETETLSYTIDRTTNEFVIDGIKYILAEESYHQVKYYLLVPHGTNLTSYVIFLLQ